MATGDTDSRFAGASLRPPVSPDPAAPSASRVSCLDFIKGVLVLGMVLYHAVNYFAPRLQDLLLYLKFVSGGFIFMSGYIVVAFYGAKWSSAPGRTAVRLVVRGLKLVVLFSAINLAIGALSIRNFNSVQFGLDTFADRAFDILVFGGGRDVAFEILLPIGYMLMLSPVVLWLQRRRVILLSALALIATYGLFLSWHLGNFSLLLVGSGGMLVGCLLPPDRIAARNHLCVSLPALAAVMAGLPWLRSCLVGYLLYIVVVFKAIADLSLLWSPRWPGRRLIMLSGEYVLFNYLTQILTLQIIFRALYPCRDSSVAVLGLVVIGACLVMWTCDLAVTAARRRFRLVDRMYRFVFA